MESQKDHDYIQHPGSAAGTQINNYHSCVYQFTYAISGQEMDIELSIQSHMLTKHCLPKNLKVCFIFATLHPVAHEGELICLSSAESYVISSSSGSSLSKGQKQAFLYSLLNTFI